MFVYLHTAFVQICGMVGVGVMVLLEELTFKHKCFCVKLTLFNLKFVKISCVFMSCFYFSRMFLFI